MPLNFVGGVRLLATALMLLIPSLGWVGFCEARARRAPPATVLPPCPRPPPRVAQALAPPAQPPPRLTAPDASFVEATAALFDLQHPSSRARLQLQAGQRLLRRRRQACLVLPAHSLLVLPEVQCAPTYHTALRVEVHTDHAGHLEVLATADTGAAMPGEAQSEAPDLLLHRLNLVPGDTTANLRLPDLERLQANNPQNEAATLLVVRFVPDLGAPSAATCMLQRLELRGLSPAGA